MRLKAVYAAGSGIAAFIIVVFIIYNTGTHTNNISSSSNSNGRQANNIAMPLMLSVKSIVPSQLNDHLASIGISFNATNPNRGTAILEAIEYHILVDNKIVSLGTIGERLEGFLASSAGIYPIIGDGSVILKDKQLFQKNNSTAIIWNKVIEGKANYIVIGTMSYRQISSLQASSIDKDFRLVYR
jgi:hypothetical protein